MKNKTFNSNIENIFSTLTNEQKNEYKNKQCRIDKSSIIIGIVFAIILVSIIVGFGIWLITEKEYALLAFTAVVAVLLGAIVYWFISSGIRGLKSTDEVIIKRYIERLERQKNIATTNVAIMETSTEHAHSFKEAINLKMSGAFTETNIEAKPSLEEINLLTQLTNEYYKVFSANENLVEIVNKNLKPCSLLLLELSCIPFQKCKIITKTYKSADAKKYHWEWDIVSSKELYEFKLSEQILTTGTDYKNFIECIKCSEIKDFYIKHWYGDIVKRYNVSTENIRVGNMDLTYKDTIEKITNEELSFLQDMFTLFSRNNIIEINLSISDNGELNRQAAYNAFIFLYRCLYIQDLIKKIKSDNMFSLNNENILEKGENTKLTSSAYKEAVINSMRSSIIECNEEKLQFWFALLDYCEKPISTPFFKLYYQEEENALKIVQEIKDKEQLELLKNGNLKNKHTYSMLEIDNMMPAQFEIFVAELFNSLGYQAESTKLSGDQGVDVIAKKGSQTLAIQAKHYNQTVGNHAIMEVVGGAKMYNATLCYVVTNNYFTKSAKELAAANNVILWDRDKLMEKLSEF